MKDITMDTIQRYVEWGCEPGDFMRAVFENNLCESFGRADLDNREDMFEIVEYIYNNTPSECWGSPAKVSAWMKKKLEERKAAREKEVGQ